MSVLPQDAARRIVERLSWPLERNRAAAQAFAAGLAVEWSYNGTEAWRPHVRDRAFGLQRVVCTPNWQNPDIEWRPTDRGDWSLAADARMVAE